ncbi:MAG: hypothetical protein IKO07_13920 [Clostridia bacterium]|nr:hypothetical protein [Clostridia bacterium]
MAVVAEIRASNGALVRIHDDFMAPKGSEEEARRIEAQRRAAYDILVEYAQREATKNENKEDSSKS